VMGLGIETDVGEGVEDEMGDRGRDGIELD
jgi:hypothetical protein